MRWFRIVLALLCLTLVRVSPAAPDVGAIRNHLVYYGDWRDADVVVFGQYDLVVLQPGRYHGSSAAAAIRQIRSQGAIVLLYVSIGEDMRTFGNLPALRGDGRGPSYWDDATGSVAYENRGVASYYLDQWNAAGYGSDLANKVPDGVPDRHGSFGAIMVDAGDPAWQAVVLDTCRRIAALGGDGFFLDTPETADPWRGYGWTAQGMHDLIAAIRREFPPAVLLLNRGLFFFDPNHPYQFQWNPRHLVDIALFESGYLDNDYPSDRGGNGAYHISPYHLYNEFYLSPKVNAELGRKDSYRPVVAVDYAGDPEEFPSRHPGVYGDLVREVVLEQGRIPLLTNRLLDIAPSAAIDHAAAPDRAAPRWQNTTVGCKQLFATPRPFYMTRCEATWSEADLAASPPLPRVGLQKAFAIDGAVTLQWDVAIDQTRPVKYNVYWSTTDPLDFDRASRLVDVAAEPGPDYATRSFTASDLVNPYQFTVKGLQDGVRYLFAVRAEDATRGVASPSSGRIGPGGGIEETNSVTLALTPGSGEIKESGATGSLPGGRFRVAVGRDRSIVFTFSNPLGDGRIEIADARGRQFAVFPRIPSERFVWDGGGLQNGVYFVHYRIAGESGGERFVIAR